MSAFAWLTPEDQPDGECCIRLIIPNGDEWETIVRGALAALGEAENFEQFGTLTPEETAQIFREALLSTFEWIEC